MKKESFPYIAATLGLILTMIVFKGSGLRDDGRTIIPLLTLLIVCEFGAIVTAVATYIGLKELIVTRKPTVITAVSLLCALLSAEFVIRGLQLWPH